MAKSSRRVIVHAAWIATASAILTLIPARNVWACSFDFGVRPQLVANSASISKVDIAKVADRVKQMNGDFDDRWQVVIVGSASRDEHAPQALATKRAENARKVLDDLGVQPSHIVFIDTHIMSPKLKINDDFDPVDFMFSPICPPEGCDSLCGSPATPASATTKRHPLTPPPHSPPNTPPAPGYPAPAPATARIARPCRSPAHKPAKQS